MIGSAAASVVKANAFFRLAIRFVNDDGGCFMLHYACCCCCKKHGSLGTTIRSAKIRGNNMNESRTVAHLRQNDPDETAVFIQLRPEEDDVALAEALEQNDYVSSIGFHVLQQMERWDNLLRVLATREKLKKVQFDGSWERWESSRHPPITAMDDAMFLQAVQQNPSVHTVGFLQCDLALGEIMSSLLDTATSLTEFELVCCNMTTQGAGRIGGSLQRNTNLQTLKLGELEESNLIPILQGLETNAFLQSLSLSFNYQTLGQPLSLAIQLLLVGTSSPILHLKLKHLFFPAECSRPFFDGLVCSTTLSKVQFHHCFFTDLASMDLFRQMIETKPNLQLLSIEYCSFPDSSKHLLRDSLSAILLHPNSLLRTFELMQGDQNTLFPGPTFGALLSAVGRSSLERFNIGDIFSDEQFQSLLSSLPAMKIHDLEFRMVWPLRNGENRRQEVLRAVKQNFSLRSLKASFAGSAFFTEDDENLLRVYFDRNECLAQWVANPVTVPHLLWPDALGLAVEAGEDTMYRSLQAVLGDEVESALGQRKQKRQAHKDKTM